MGNYQQISTKVFINATCVLSAFLFCILLSACSSMLMIRPTLINRLWVKEIKTGTEAELVRPRLLLKDIGGGKQEKIQEGDNWLAGPQIDKLVYQMSPHYKDIGQCADNDDHVYEAKFYNVDILELNVFINKDGSVCKNGRRYIQEDGSSNPVDLDDWVTCFNLYGHAYDQNNTSITVNEGALFMIKIPERPRYELDYVISDTSRLNSEWDRYESGAEDSALKDRILAFKALAKGNAVITIYMPGDESTPQKFVLFHVTIK